MTTETTSLRLRLPATARHLRFVRAACEQALRMDPRHGLRDEDVDEILLALQECLANVVRHSYGGTGGIVDVSIALRHGWFFAKLRDFGLPIDPERWCAEQGDPAAPRDHGNGLTLLRRTMDVVRQQRRGAANVVFLCRSPRRAPIGVSALPEIAVRSASSGAFLASDETCEPAAPAARPESR